MKKCYTNASCFLIICLAGTGAWRPSTDHAILTGRDSTGVTWAGITTTVGDGIIVLNWKVLNEKNTLRYEILRTADTTVRYTVIGKVRALTANLTANAGSTAGSTSTASPTSKASSTSTASPTTATTLPAVTGKAPDSLNYTFTDFTVLPNTVYYYKLHQVCRSKLLSFSSIVSAKASDPDQKINIYPNPANTFIYVANIGGSGMLRIYDQSGQNVLEVALNGEQQQVNISALHTGSYYARVDREGKVQYQQVLVVN
jgi:Secretion system C-terminal sorting domain